MFHCASHRVWTEWDAKSNGDIKAEDRCRNWMSMIANWHGSLRVYYHQVRENYPLSWRHNDFATFATSWFLKPATKGIFCWIDPTIIRDVIHQRAHVLLSLYFCHLMSFLSTELVKYWNVGMEFFKWSSPLALTALVIHHSKEFV